MAPEPLIDDLAFLSDCHRSVLVDRSLDVVWMCAPRFDSPSVFGAVLDPSAGSTGIRVAEVRDTRRRYLDDALVLATEVRTATGTLVVTDALASGPNDDGHDLCMDPPGVLVRRVECVDGHVDVEVHFAPRPEYGLVDPLMRADETGVRARGGADRVRLCCPWPAQVEDGSARATGTLREGDAVLLGVEHRPVEAAPPPARSQRDLQDMLDETVQAWRSWSSLHQAYQGPYREVVHLSGRVLYGLTYRPTGAVVAAPTTSLPEELGGSRNWDYRYSWLRDASWTMSALWVAACPDEAGMFFDHLAWTCAAQVRHRLVQIMFGVGGEHDLTERELPHLQGYASSRPVRIGNDAWRQHQLDVYGELLDAAYRLREQIGTPEPHVTDLLVAFADAAAAHWQEPDHGIWEMRGPPRRFLHSALMCWVALDRAARLAEQMGAGDRGDRWRREADSVRDAILEHGWSEELGGFAQSFDSSEPDASALMVPMVGFLPGDDPRVLGTLDAIERHLVDERGLVRRYRTDTSSDGVEGSEGSFLLCTFWLAQAFARAGRVQQAGEYFDRAVAHANDVGLLAEEVDTATGRLLGNFPQAFSHVGLVNAAWDLDWAIEQTRSDSTGPEHDGGDHDARDA